MKEATDFLMLVNQCLLLVGLVLLIIITAKKL